MKWEQVGPVIKGFNGFPDGKMVGSGISVQNKNGVTISHWERFYHK
ncbi:MAG TPA: hypothetical protein VJ599_09970 [Nitrososphaeraceae archaeon]|nr:hypothetical protein [Nitrososphaeraceae archaeon]